MNALASAMGICAVMGVIVAREICPYFVVFVAVAVVLHVQNILPTR